MWLTFMPNEHCFPYKFNHMVNFTVWKFGFVLSVVTAIFLKQLKQMIFFQMLFALMAVGQIKIH